ncbi:hypothetical protein BGZ75_003370 [Mortierella antarctica]|nr:hypothetical protein BGZ75_003370 [Mortierella antarctica]
MSTHEPPKVMIVGAGMGGLMLANFLERQNVPYVIYERASQLKALGSAMGFGANILPAFEQLGLLKELHELSLPCKGLEILDKELNHLSSLDFSEHKATTGYDTIMFVRPKMHSLLLSRIPPEKIVLSKRVLSLEQNELGVMLRMADGSTYHGDIVVGADGAYSGVRQGLYKHVDKKGLLPATDKEEMKLGYLCMVGTTEPLDPAKFPVVAEETSVFQRVISDTEPYTWHTVNMRDNRLCWGIVGQIDSASASKETAFRNSEWGPESDDGGMEQMYDCPTPAGGVLRDLVNATPKDQISKIFLQEKLFETWSYGRTVLLGDGAVNAMQDAVVLANCIYEIGEVTPENITAAFKRYRDQRYSHVKKMITKSKLMGMIQYGQTWKDRLVRHVMFNWIPKKVQTEQYMKDAAVRPQACYLPQVENRGSAPVIPQEPSKRFVEEQARKNKSVVV